MSALTSFVRPLWATDSLRQSVKVGIYDVRLANGHVADNGHEEQWVEATIISPTQAKYVRDHKAADEEQLMKAARRLADLLNAINRR